jgi:hypothetical protein
MDLHGVAELNCTNKQNYTIHGVGSADLHGVAELNCTNKQNNMQNQTVQISKQYTEPNCTNRQNYTNIPMYTLNHTNTTTSKRLNTAQHNAIHINLMHETFNACAGTCEDCADNACLQKMIKQASEWRKMMQRCV